MGQQNIETRRKIGERLRKWGVDAFGSVGALGEKLGLANITQYLNGDRIPGPKIQARIRALDGDVEWIMTGIESLVDTEKPPGRSILLYSIQNPGGSSMLKEEPIPATLPEQFFTGSDAIAVIVPDNTLSPILHKNDIIYVEGSKAPTDKDLYLVRVKGKGHLIRHILISGELCTLIAPGAPSLTIPAAKLLESRKVIAATIFGVHLKHK